MLRRAEILAETQTRPTNSDKMPHWGGFDNYWGHGLCGSANTNGYGGCGWRGGGNAGAIYHPGAKGSGNVGGIYGPGNIIIINNYSSGNLDRPVMPIRRPKDEDEDEDEEDEEEDEGDDDEDEEEDEDDERSATERFRYHLKRLSMQLQATTLRQIRK